MLTREFPLCYFYSIDTAADGDVHINIVKKKDYSMYLCPLRFVVKFTSQPIGAISQSFYTFQDILPVHKIQKRKL